MIPITGEVEFSLTGQARQLGLAVDMDQKAITLPASTRLFTIVSRDSLPSESQRASNRFRMIGFSMVRSQHKGGKWAMRCRPCLVGL